MKIKEIWFDAEHIYGRDEEGNEYSQSLLWYPKLRMATDEERAAYTFGFDGIHWRELDEDISFESFAYDDAEPTSLQRFFLTHKEINPTTILSYPQGNQRSRVCPLIRHECHLTT